MEFTLIIQGKLSIYTLLSILKYKEEFNIVIVTPKTSNEKLIKECFNISISNQNISCILYDENVNRPEFNNVQNRYFHFLSTHLGLEVSSTKYSIKLRSDEFYSDLNPFMKKIKENPDKIITNDVFFRKSSFKRFHPSDHLVGGKTQLMRKIFTKAKNYSENPKEIQNSPWRRDDESITAENQLCFSIFDIKENPETEKSDYKLMKDNIDIVLSQDLGFFRVAWNSNGSKEFFDSSYYNQDFDIKNIEELKEPTDHIKIISK
jgi:hypothetical protein